MVQLKIQIEFMTSYQISFTKVASHYKYQVRENRNKSKGNPYFFGGFHVKTFQQDKLALTTKIG